MIFREFPMFPIQGHLGERLIENEEQVILRGISGLAAAYRKGNPLNTEGPHHFHRKPHGLLEGELIIEENLEGYLKVAFYKTKRTFPVLIRVSNGSISAQSDWIPGVRGLAMKIPDVPGAKLIHDGMGEFGSQDIIFSTGENFAMGSSAQFVEFSKSPAAFLASPSHLRNVAALAGAFKAAANPLTYEWFTQTSYRWGDLAGRVMLKPWMCNESGAGPWNYFTPNYLRRCMVDHLKHREARFDLCVQVQLNTDKQPVEDATVSWGTPYKKVATLVIRPQEFDTKAQNDRGERLSFNPGHCLPEFQPLGSVNRMRVPLYQEMFRLRSRGAAIL